MLSRLDLKFDVLNLNNDKRFYPRNFNNIEKAFFLRFH